jgi:ribosomal-protein-alanine N-acetyltransferase
MTSAAIEIPGSPVLIEPAGWKDLNAVRHLEQVCFPLDAWPLWDILGVLTFPNVVRLKAVDNGIMVGFIAGDLRPHENLAWIATIGVLPEYRRQGIGAALLQACEKRLTLPRIRLMVRISNQDALQLYRRAGYHQAGVWPHYYQNGEDAYILEKQR